MSELAIASVKPQEWEQPFEIPTAFRNGNLFPGLQKPFFVEEEDSLEVHAEKRAGGYAASDSADQLRADRHHAVFWIPIPDTRRRRR